MPPVTSAARTSATSISTPPSAAPEAIATWNIITTRPLAASRRSGSTRATQVWASVGMPPKPMPQITTAARTLPKWSDRSAKPMVAVPIRTGASSSAVRSRASASGPATRLPTKAAAPNTISSVARPAEPRPGTRSAAGRT